MRICIAQIRTKSAAVEENFSQIEQALYYAQRQQADLIVFPEMAIPGYFVGDAWERQSFLQKCNEYNLRIASLSSDAPVIFGSVGIDPVARNEDGRVRKYNAAFIAQNGRLLINPATNLPFWPKTLMPNYREFDDSRHFYDLRKLAQERQRPLQKLLTLVELKLANGQTIKTGVGICEDAWSDDYGLHPYDMMASEHGAADLLVNISCSPFTLGKQARRKKLFGRISQKHACPMVYVNSVGTQNVGKTIYSFDGDSGVYFPNGFEGVASPFEATNGILTVDKRQTSSTQNNFPLSSETAHRVTELQASLEAGLRFVREEWRLEKVVVGVSGGIDSALSAVLHSRVFGAENVFCVNMPSQFNSPLTKNAAQNLARNLGCRYASVGIEDSVGLTLRQLESARAQGLPIPENLPSLVRENIQARDRGSRIIAGVSASLAAVFPCNANKTELTVGYSTLYGDHAGYLAPIADLWKGDVYALARHYNEAVFTSEIIPSDTLTVVPSAELSDEQDVTQGKGDPLCYPYHDALFRLWVEDWNRFDFEATLAAWDSGTLDVHLGPDASQHMRRLFKSRDEFRKDLKRWWNAYVGMGAFKRVQAPPILAVTRRAFGFDHREFIGAPLES